MEYIRVPITHIQPSNWEPPSKACRGCLNNTGGGCLYNIGLEAKENGCTVEELCNKEYCNYADYDSKN